jgi:hypothetical protein
MCKPHINLNEMRKIIKILVQDSRFSDRVSSQAPSEYCCLEAGHVERMGEKRTAYRLLVGKPEGKRPLGRQRRRWVEKVLIFSTLS